MWRRAREWRPTPATPAETERRDGLSYSLWLPERAPAGGVVVLHGAGSRKENHHDFARMARDSGFAAIAFDQRGHGASGGVMDGRAIADVVAMAALLRERAGPSAGGEPLPVALRGSSLGGYLALTAAAPARAAGVVAICPASAEMLMRGVRERRYDVPVDEDELTALLAAHDDTEAIAALTVPVLILHAQGDEVVPVEHSRSLAQRGGRVKLIAVPGGHHRSVQHDAELQGESLRFLRRALRTA